jgi:opacity protein-like surface antigen
MRGVRSETEVSDEGVENNTRGRVCSPRLGILKKMLGLWIFNVHIAFTMKIKTFIATTLLTANAFAGTSAKQVMIPETPAPAPCNWFMGATYGQSFGNGDGDQIFRTTGGNAVSSGEFDFDLYTFHIGKEFDYKFLGCDTAAYFEVAYLDGEIDFPLSRQNFFSRTETDANVIPLTLNYKLERNLFGSLNAYATAGVGYAFLIADNNLNVATDISLNGGGFYAQASTGLLYNINEDWEAYAGIRWLHLSSIESDSSSAVFELELEDSFAWEIGARYNF